MEEAPSSQARRRALLLGLPDEIVIWEILARLDPKSLLRCRAVHRAWRCTTSSRSFLLARHARQPTLPTLSCNECHLGVRCRDILVFDHRAATDAHLHSVAWLDDAFHLEASCDGLLILSKFNMTASGTSFSVCNPATREHALLGPPRDFKILGMYPHRPTGEHRLLLKQRRLNLIAKYPIGCYVFVLGSNQPPRYIGWPEAASGIFNVPVRVRDSLHWYPVHYPSENNPLDYRTESQLVIVFDTIAESFGQMHAPIVPTNSYLFEMSGTLGIHSRDHAKEIIDIWVLQDYKSEAWDLKYRLKLPVVEIRKEFQGCRDCCDFDVVSVDGDVLLLLNFASWLFHVDSDGKLINSFYRSRQELSMSECRLKQSLVQHTFFPALEGYSVNTSPFIGPI
ncbi:F-box protein At5g49610-like [Aegilops tauschii subsp. strangulata]|uniref:F-box protein At5g49610-like n=1 Tax=Aegilops tauschii subsp. strangulata TaxID=200361 RepID=UPI00098A4EB5|nr:uncharacterized protein LOC109766387 [Aegilops tauschii subsp. strangulata]